MGAGPMTLTIEKGNGHVVALRNLFRSNYGGIPGVRPRAFSQPNMLGGLNLRITLMGRFRVCWQIAGSRARFWGPHPDP